MNEILTWRLVNIKSYYNALKEAEKTTNLKVQNDLREMLNLHIRYYLHSGGNQDISKYVEYYV